MTRCEEFYEKWKRDPNWCEKSRAEVYRINKYIETLDAYPGLEKVTATALRPILDRKMDEETKKKLLSTIETQAKSGVPVTSSDIEILVGASTKVDKEPQIKARLEQQIIHATTWKETMSPKISKMDEAVFDSLVQKGVGALFQESVCVKMLIPDIVVKKGSKNYAVFRDGPVHEGREDRDEANRQLLARQGFEVISIPYDGYSNETRDSIVQQIIETIS